MMVAVLPARLARYWPIFEEAGRKHAVDPLLLAAICDHESRGGEALTPRGPTGVGDNGHACGLMQLDRRYHADFIARTTPTGLPLWCVPEWNIAYAASLLADELHAFQGDEACAVAAYNASRKRVKAARDALTKPIAPDALVAALDGLTTGHNYVASILAARAAFTPAPEP